MIERTPGVNMSWGELSCVHFQGTCPNPNCSFGTCNTSCEYYKCIELLKFEDLLTIRYGLTLFDRTYIEQNNTWTEND